MTTENDDAYALHVAHQRQLKLIDAVTTGVKRCRKELLGSEYHKTRLDACVAAVMVIMEAELSIGETMVVAQYLYEAIGDNVEAEQKLEAATVATS